MGCSAPSANYPGPPWNVDVGVTSRAMFPFMAEQDKEYMLKLLPKFKESFKTFVDELQPFLLLPDVVNRIAKAREEGEKDYMAYSSAWEAAWNAPDIVEVPFDANKMGENEQGGKDGGEPSAAELVGEPSAAELEKKKKEEIVAGKRKAVEDPEQTPSPKKKK